MPGYDPGAIENKWITTWEKEDLYSTPEKVDPENKMYILPQLPYPSGSGLHMGHSEVYAACDIYARYQRMQSKDVLQVIGWDAFGLPAENYAIKTNIHPKVNTNQAIDNFKEQIKSLGVSVDWDRSVGSHESEYYKWTQWFFLLMYERGLAYRQKQVVNWCPHDKTVLANEQVEEGKCERCGNEVELKEMEQWYLRITDYAQRLYDDLDKVDWPQETVKRQRDWIGKSEGAKIKFPVVQTTQSGKIGELEVFSTAHDTIYGATFMVIAPEHEILEQILPLASNTDEVQAYITEAKQKTELQRQQQKDKNGIKIEGIQAINPITEESLPVFVADYVLTGYGTGAIMAVPGHDARDYEFAEKYDLPIRYLVEGEKFVDYGKDIKENLENYNITNSQEFDGLSFAEARPQILEKLQNLEAGEKSVEFKLRDWSVSRQRFWGAPIPMVYDPEGNLHPVAIDDLPVELPDDVDFKPTGQSPLTYSQSFQEGVEEKYGKGWRREVDTLDTFMCSSWYFFRYVDPHNQEKFASKEALDTWMPVDFYLGGPEHVNGHLLYSRFFTKVLYDAGYINFDEPFSVHRHQGLIKGPDGRKMSKRWGNIVNPTDAVAEHGADTTRMYLMFMGPLEEDKSWDPKAIQGVRRFLNKVWDLHTKVDASTEDEQQVAELHKFIKALTEDIENLSFNTAIAKAMEFGNFLQEQRQIQQSVWEQFLVLLAPFSPFITEELWHKLGHKQSVHQQTWPQYDANLIASSELEIAVQVNGKVKETLKVSKDAKEEEVLEQAKKLTKVANSLQDGEVVKEIYVPGKIINFVVK